VSATLLPYRGVLPRVAERVFIAPGAKVIGDVEIGSDSSIWFGCVVRGDVNVVRIGERTNIQDGTVVHVAREGQGTFIGSDITIGRCCTPARWRAAVSSVCAPRSWMAAWSNAERWWRRAR
jgi:carbonic anhydrase/acetyltransferase-like protein (isoleucine patch superfamily)